MSPIVLRPYQNWLINEVRNAFRNTRRVLAVSPTGSGKTVLFSQIGRKVAARGKSICFLGHKQEIVEQIASAFGCIGLEYGVIAAGFRSKSGPVQIASVQTLAKRIRASQPFDWIIIDEAHHAVAGSWDKILANHPNARVLGVTATPERLDGQGLGGVFDHLVVGPSVADLTRARFLVPSVVYAPPVHVDLSAVKTRDGDFAADDASRVMSAAPLVGNAVEHYKRLCCGVPAVAFRCGIEHSRTVAERFIAAGIGAAHVDGDVSPTERRQRIQALGTGEIQVLCNAGLISEGVDVPAIGAVILLRLTQSLSLYLQQVGRALRPSPGKTQAIVLDHAGNSWRHGLPDAHREWSLLGRPRMERENDFQNHPRLRHCTEYSALNSPASKICNACRVELRPSIAERPEIDAPLVELNPAQIQELLRRGYPEVLRWATDEEKLRRAAQALGYKPGWVRYRLRELRDQGVAA